jgi:hypothetical protein
MIRKRPELDMENPPGQIVNDVGAPPHMEKPLQKHIDDYVADTEELFYSQTTFFIPNRVKRTFKG